jgi:SAM-dependent methyltransferase
VFGEVARVLRPGGRFLVKTPNRRHYVPLVARLTPHAFHRRFNRMRGRGGADTFPTRYRVNTPGALRRSAARAGLEVERVRLCEARPEYLRFHPLAYAAGWGWERAVNALPGLAAFRVLLVARLRKPAAAESAAA